MVGDCKSIFSKELEKNLAHIELMKKLWGISWKLIKKIPNFICSSPTSTKVSGQDEETKVGLSGIAQEEEI